jgi:hypothetical protein
MTTGKAPRDDGDWPRDPSDDLRLRNSTEALYQELRSSSRNVAEPREYHHAAKSAPNMPRSAVGIVFSLALKVIVLVALLYFPFLWLKGCVGLS